MPMIFHKAAAGWATLAISAPRGVLTLSPVRFDPAPDAAGAGERGCFVAHAEPEGHWILIRHRDERLLHNGQILAAGARVLAHMDALALEGAEPVFFSTEETARIEAFAGAAAVTCPRCRLRILPGEPAVKCPRCGVVHHEADERNCWSYAPACACCPQPTAFDAGLQWTPEAL